MSVVVPACVAGASHADFPIEPYVVAGTGEGGTAGKPTSSIRAPLRKYASLVEALDAHGKSCSPTSPNSPPKWRCTTLRPKEYGPRLLALNVKL